MLRPMRNIRRYNNRKLYDTQESHYVTLPQIAALIRSGEEIRVTSKETGKDLTASTMAQIIFEETKGGLALPVSGLRQILVSGLPLE
jgi:polyhydroxyalkanoate synthesis repressor PhaR